MGAVYLAEDTRLGRQCAVKENIPDPNANPQVLAQMRQQFQAEARILAALDHPNLPKVYDFFADSGNEYIVIEYIEGEDLASVLQRHGGSLPEKPVLIWCQQVLDALTYLHTLTPYPIIHRDIKPANIVLTAQGKVKLVDFGLVKLLDTFSPQTISAMKGIGTPEYTPQEQYAGGGHTDARSDIYALGATLYHLLTGIPPPSAPQRFVDPSLLLPPQQLVPALSPHIGMTILKALELHPSQRFQSALEMQSALRGAIIALGPSATLGPSAPVQPIQRSPLSLMWGILLAAVVLGAGLFALSRRSAAPTVVAPIVTSTPASAAVFIAPTYTGTSVLLRSTSTPVPQPTPTNLPTNTVGPTSTSEPVATATPLPSLVPTSTAQPGRARLGTSNADRIETLFVLQDSPQYAVECLAMAPDGLSIATGIARRENPTVSIWSLRDQQIISRLALPERVSSLAYSPDGRTLAVGIWDLTVQIWDLASGQATKTLTDHRTIPTSLVFSYDNAYLVSGGDYGGGDNNGQIVVWQSADWAVVQSIQEKWGAIKGVSLNGSGGLIAGGGMDGKVRVYFSSSNTPWQVLEGGSGGVDTTAFSPDGRLFAFGGWDQTVHIYRLEDHALVRDLTGHAAGVNSIAFSPDGALLAAGTEDGRVWLWRVDDGASARILTGHAKRITQVAFTPDGSLLVSGSWDGAVRVWGVPNP